MAFRSFRSGAIALSTYASSSSFFFPFFSERLQVVQPKLYDHPGNIGLLHRFPIPRLQPQDSEQESSVDDDYMDIDDEAYIAFLAYAFHTTEASPGPTSKERKHATRLMGILL